MARAMPDGEVVTVKGIALNGPELGAIRYIQDETGGIALYPGAGSVEGLENVKAGDEVLVSGVLDPYQGLLELNPLLSLEILSQENDLPDPQTVFPADFNEQRESEHVSLQCVSFEDPGFFEADETYTLSHYGGIGFQLFVPEGHPLVGKPIPGSPVDLTGILSRSNGFRMLVRGEEDIPASPCLYFTTGLLPLEMETHSLHLFWKTSQPCACKVTWGLTPEMENETEDAQELQVHSFTLGSLEPATAYYVRAFCQSGGFWITSPVRIFSTASISTGEIRVYFNQETDPSVSAGTFPAGDSWLEAEAAILERIDQAESTIDAAVYNANLDSWVDALKAAHDRGVQVRYIYEDEASNSALSGPLPFPILEANPVALMHNKFLSIDAGDPGKAWLINGSMNWTSSGLKNDNNNILFIQDQAIAKAFRTEFEEMWGGSGAQPDPSKARFGPAKVENTPAFFRIGGKPVQLYFTPSDHIVRDLTALLGSAEADLEFGLFILTLDELSAALKDAWFEGLDVRGIIEDTDISGSDYGFLLSQGVPVQEHEPYGLFHHKYALVDAQSGDDPMVITGSYNWTSAATTSNDENVLVIHDAGIANQFLQEFEARWAELVPVKERVGEDFSFSVFPNPAAGEFWVQYAGPPLENCVFRLWDFTGRLCLEMPVDQLNTGRSVQFSNPMNIPGPYLLTCTLSNSRQVSVIVVNQ